ncbi:transcriptional regulator, GntR family protein [Vibrio ichthyoenteri ATCC 700023]|uniref:Transcriptional regulator, GntR family protein n=1 Tax=Vibrio ichthyoenteri ATCC 700023 TaxID=870968 RepID=F9S2R9_9VIBR|nr:GntR family transcriptional regulator [Vibrio ichthyoenteri]EGU38843.1 transcriptional regulator, GntR family protein [Vibrio ichthyoenteri ATCC 700023]
MTLALTGKKQIVVEFIERKIADNKIPAGEKLDTESGIAKALGITRATVREATRYLVEKGIIYRVNGSGLYVGSPNKQSSGNFHVLSPFDHQAQQAGQSAVRQVLSSAIIEVPSVQIAHALRIKPNEKIYYLERLMSFGNMPVSFEKIHIPINVCDSFEFNKVEESKYSYMEQLTGKKVQLREQDISAFNLSDAGLADLLKVYEGQAMIELRELVSFDDGTPFEYTVATINSDLFNIHQVVRR